MTGCRLKNSKSMTGWRQNQGVGKGVGRLFADTLNPRDFLIIILKNLSLFKGVGAMVEKIPYRAMEWCGG
jgi:hypothetical protein